MSHSFDGIEGQYQSFSSELCVLEKQIQMNQFGVGNAAIRLSFLEYYCKNETPHFQADADYDGSIFCINIGNEIRIYTQENANSSHERRFCGNSPAHVRFKAPLTSHCFRRSTDKVKDSQLLIGLANGEIKLIDPLKEDPNKVFNEGKSVDGTPVTCVSWVPHSPHQFLVSHSSGCMYLYDETLTQLSAPTYNLFKQGIGFSVHTCKTKSTRNPLYRWTLGSPSAQKFDNTRVLSKHPDYANGFVTNKIYETQNNSLTNSSTISSLFDDSNVSINQFAFSPCGRFLAIITEDGYMRVMEYHEMELYGFMRSYFGGLLCVDWSPDSLFIVTGGQDDLVTVWSVLDRAVICRGQGHRSWVSMVRFDPYLCPINNDISNDDSMSTSSCSHSLTANHEQLDRKSVTRNSPVTVCENNDLRTYRLGSVGHDTMLCLWDLTDDIIRQGVQFIRSSIKNANDDFGSFAYPRLRNSNIHNMTSSAVLSCNSSALPSPQSGNGSSTSSTISPPHIHSSQPSMKLTDSRFLDKHKNVIGSAPSSELLTNGTNNSGSDKSRSIFTLRGFHWSNSNNRISTNSRFSRLGNSDKSNGTATNSLKSCNLSRLSEARWMLSITENNIFGSPLCPRINDVPMLEPLVCTRILKDRVTDFVFRRDTIHIVDQQGLFLIWQRPIEVKENSLVSQIPLYHSNDWDSSASAINRAF
ncbi:WD repeat-containing protein isoform 1 [Schistosoma japonicum]|uniref:WD repeat-containing protein isoform 1 n=1 Tax=Schistosoma japonicum TaxID=6182 RepID=A0A4Z2D3A8_SCHJA|nr:WD repeat-containing protein isoform 1 [Schistosoma japonicum]